MIETIFSMGITDKNGLYHIWVVGKNGVKVFFSDHESVEGHWTEDICLKAESSDFAFVYESLADLLKDEVVASELEASLLF